jgi:hypothetical protein
MIQSGVVSVLSRRQALRKRESWRAGGIKTDFGIPRAGRPELESFPLQEALLDDIPGVASGSAVFEGIQTAIEFVLLGLRWWQDQILLRDAVPGLFDKSNALSDGETFEIDWQ